MKQYNAFNNKRGASVEFRRRKYLKKSVTVIDYEQKKSVDRLNY